VQELYPEGDFLKYLNLREKNFFSEDEILRFLANIILVVFDINSRNVYHRDLKPANFLIKRDKNGRIYLHLNDFGTAKSTIIDENKIISSIGFNHGTLFYMAPEILNSTEKSVVTKEDVWAIGVIAYEICTFTLPFRGSSGALLNAILNSPH
jgi:eukaryotic-like serine/threonine-protein kinase